MAIAVAAEAPATNTQTRTDQIAIASPAATRKTVAVFGTATSKHGDTKNIHIPVMLTCPVTPHQNGGSMYIT
jgi:hypothetical protein